MLSVAPNDPAAQQQRQSAIAMQAELAKVHGGEPAAAAPKEAVAAPAPVAPSDSTMATIPKGTFPATPPSLTEAARLIIQKEIY